MSIKHVKAHAAQKAVVEAVVVVTNNKSGFPIRWLGLLCCLLTPMAWSAVLPEDRADLMYHSYDGGGVTIDGPAVLVRKSVRKDVSLSAQYYVDQISGASIDVESTASAYSEERTQYDLSADYLLNKTIITAGLSNSTENDYDADTYFVGVSQDFFGDLSTLSINYAYGDDSVGKSTDATFQEDIRRHSYQVTWTQVMTKNLLMGFSYQAITDQGYLNNPYRSFRYIDNTVPKGYSYAPEIYPETRTTQALAIRGKYFLPYRAALNFEYRSFRDTWDIDAYNLDLGYTHPLGDRWIFDIHFRIYEQGEAEFYSDLFPRIDSQNYMARDKELSEFSSNTVGVKVSYEFDTRWASWIDRGTANIAWDLISYDYDNFRNVLATGYAAGQEPEYSFDATVIRLFVSAWF